MRLDWKRLLIQILSALAGGMASVNLGRLTVPDVGAGALELAGWVVLPAVASLAGLIAQRFVASPAAGGKPGSPGHAEFCQSVYELARSLELERLQALVEAWKKTAPPEPKP